MTGTLDSLREDIARQFRKHCVSCTGSCCALELEEGFLAFGWEFDNLSKVSPIHASGGQGTIRLVPFDNNRRCQFSGSNACKLTLGQRPLDCLTYPVYPQVAFDEEGGKQLTGLMVRTGCRKLKEIFQDTALMELVRSFWELELPLLEGSELKEWTRVVEG